MSDLTLMVWAEESPASARPLLEAEAGRTCRMRDCGRPATWALWRQYRAIQGRRRGQWWLYCVEDNYGRKFEDGVIYSPCRRDSPYHLEALEQGRRVMDAPDLEAKYQELDRRGRELEQEAAEGEEERRTMGSGR